jgi:hypothetical protein
LSTVGANLPPNLDYDFESGTSLASPHVTGLIGYLLNLRPDLTAEQVIGLVRQDQFTTTTVFSVDEGVIPSTLADPRPRPMIDGFAAALGIDILKGTKNIQKGLVDVDDGTIDGNLLRDPFSGVDLVGLNTEHPQDANQRLRGDGKVTMRDFRAWRDAYLATHAHDFAATPLLVELDGPKAHFKRDLNEDGCVGENIVTHADPASAAMSCDSAPNENVYPRFDFNGDGKIGDWTDTAPFKIDPDDHAGPTSNDSTLHPAFEPTTKPGFYRDIDVLAEPELWSLTENNGYSENVATDPRVEGDPVGGDGFWQSWAYLLQQDDPDTAAEVLKKTPDFIHSFDVHVEIDWSTIDPDYEEVVIHIQSEKEGPDFAEVFQREARIPFGMELSVIATIPLWTGNVKVRYEGIDNDDPNPSPNQDGALPRQVRRWLSVKLAEDRPILIQGLSVIDTIFNPDAQNRGFPPNFRPVEIAVDSSGRIHVAYRHDVGA